ncbi:MAG: ABC transporter substrate-binding protein, partial [Elusimicrobia bacterium]|nr:ABC transporter substrate-binding protein [Elusimicrobiota bacterium]
GRSHECDYPEAVKSLPSCTEPVIDVSASSQDIDRQVRKSLRDALSIYRVHDEILAELKPDVILTQTQCEVCAVSLRDVEAALARRAGIKARVVSLCPNRLDDVYDDIRRVSRALERPMAGAALVGEMRARMERVSRAAAEASGKSPRPRVACLEWVDPMMASGNWMPELVSSAGGEALFGRAGVHSPAISLEELFAAEPDAILVSPCGFDLERTAAEIPALTGLPGWSKIRAVRQGRVFMADGNQYFNRPGPRLADSLEILAEILHPSLRRPGLQGPAWRVLPN